MENFAKQASSFTRNPLGIIALFIVLIYGFAALLMGATIDHLAGVERLILTIFVVAFPCLVLASFVCLVIHHHSKLYAPSEFRDEANFLGRSTTVDSAASLKKEVDSIENTSSPVPADDEIEEAAAAEAVNNDDASVQCKTDSPQERTPKIQRLARREVAERVATSERLALDKIEIERGISLSRQVNILNSPDLRFDGAAITGHQVLAIEVKYLKESFVSGDTLDQLRLRAERCEEAISKQGVHLHFIVVFVVGTETSSAETLQRRALPRLASSRYLCEVRVYRYEELLSFGLGQPA